MSDPWSSVCIESSIKQTTFEDNFKPSVKLADSQQYLEKLETRLEKIKGVSSKKDSGSVIKSLSETKESCLSRLVNSNSDVVLNDSTLDEPVNNNTLMRVIAPERQATNIGELLELVKHDQLSQTSEQAEQ